MADREQELMLWSRKLMVNAALGKLTTEHIKSYTLLKSGSIFWQAAIVPYGVPAATFPNLSFRNITELMLIMFLFMRSHLAE